MKEAQKNAGVEGFEDLRDDLEVKIFKILSCCIGCDGWSRRRPTILPGHRRSRLRRHIRLIEGSNGRGWWRVIGKSEKRARYCKSRSAFCTDT